MISGEGAKNHRMNTLSEIKLANITIKAIHDFLEEQDFVFILPAKLADIISDITRQSSDPFITTLLQNQGKVTSDQVTSHQVLMNGLRISRIYTSEHETARHSVSSKFHLETSELDFNQLLVFIEQLVRRIMIDIKIKLKREGVDIPENLLVWKDNFSAVARHEISMEFGDEWREEATLTEPQPDPFFVYCMEPPKFYDKKDPRKNGDHYLNLEFYLPGHPYPVITGGERETSYEELMSQMKQLGINRYRYSNYLLYIADNDLTKSSGITIELNELVLAITSLLN